MKKRKLGAGLGILCAVWVLAGCGGEKKEEAKQLQDTGTQILGDPAAVVAVVNGEQITLAEVDLVTGFWISIRSPELEGVRSQKDAQRRALDNIIDQHLLSAEARRQGITIPDTSVATMMAAWESRFSGPEERDQKLAASRLTVEDVRASFTRDMLVRSLVDRTIRDTVQIAPEAPRAYFEAHPEYFDTTQVHARHILVMAPADTPADTLAAARTRAEDLLRRLRAGEDFAALAQAHSADKGSATRGGDLGFTPRGRWVKPFEDAAFALRPGEISGVVQSPFGFHIIQALERREGSLAYTEELAQRIREVLSQEKVQPAVDALAARLRAGAKIELRI